MFQGDRRRSSEDGPGDAVVLLLALLAGVLTGLLGAGFRALAEAGGEAVRGLAGAADPLPAVPWLAPAAVCAVLAGVAVLLVRRLAPEAGGSGVQEIEGALDERRPVRWRRVIPVKFVAGTMSLSAGMALGREGPTIQMGGAVGRMVGELLRATPARLHVLVAAGAGAGLAAAFNAPLSGILFVFEEMRPQFRYNAVSVQAVLLACAASDATVRLALGGAYSVPAPIYPTPPMESAFLLLLFGALIGALGVLFNALLLRGLDAFAAIPDAGRVPAGAAVGAVTGVVLWWLPDVAGGGYATIHDAFSGLLPLEALLTLFGLRLLLTVVSYGSGVPGGIFAPMLALGTLVGFWFGDLAHARWPEAVPHAGVFAIAGMGAFFAATVRAPLTGIALAVELTGSFPQILPLTFAVVTATILAQRLGGRPIYSVLLERALAPSRDVRPGAAG